jgi:hypothetical protein
MMGLDDTTANAYHLGSARSGQGRRRRNGRVAACRRIIVAERLGWRRHGNPADLKLVYSFADAMNDPNQAA